MPIVEKVHWLLDFMKVYEKIVAGRVRDSVLALQCALKNEFFFIGAFPTVLETVKQQLKHRFLKLPVLVGWKKNPLHS